MNARRVKYRVVIDGPGYGVEEYMSRYGDYVPVNDEPFPTRKEAVLYMTELYEGEEPDYDWSAARRAWQHGTADLDG